MPAELELPRSARLAVLGKPIGHSRSPQIHSAAYRVLGLGWQYEAIECGEADLERFLAGLGDGQGDGGSPGAPWRGLSLTMPLKAEAHRLSAVLDPAAIESGVVNTMLHLAGGRWAGFNTDVGGLAAALDEAGLDVSRTIVLGAGATAVSAILAVRGLGAAGVSVLARRGSAARALAERFAGGGSEAFEVRGFALDDPGASDEAGRATAVISALPGHAAHELRLPEALTAVPLFDVAYDPWPSPLAERWRRSGGEAHAGIDMLVQQALLQLRIFIGGDQGTALADEAEVLAAMRIAAAGGVEE